MRRKFDSFETEKSRMIVRSKNKNVNFIPDVNEIELLFLVRF